MHHQKHNNIPELSTFSAKVEDMEVKPGRKMLSPPYFILKKKPSCVFSLHIFFFRKKYVRHPNFFRKTPLPPCVRCKQKNFIEKFSKWGPVKIHQIPPGIGYGHWYHILQYLIITWYTLFYKNQEIPSRLGVRNILAIWASMFLILFLNCS